MSDLTSSETKLATSIRAARRRHSAHVTFRHQSNDVPQALLNLQRLQRLAAAAIYSKAAIRAMIDERNVDGVFDTRTMRFFDDEGCGWEGVAEPGEQM